MVHNVSGCSVGSDCESQFGGDLDNPNSQTPRLITVERSLDLSTVTNVQSVPSTISNESNQARSHAAASEHFGKLFMRAHEHGSDDEDEPVSYEHMCRNLGAAAPAPREYCCPAAKRKKAPAPAMPRLPPRPYYEPSHHTARDWVGQLPMAMVAQLIPSKKVDDIHRKGITGRDAVRAEWANLEKRNCWDINRAKPLREASREANKRGELIHIGSMLELCYLKHSELAEEHQKLKGRVVFLGDRVRDQYGAAAIFEALASSPAGIEASRFVDAYGCMSTDGEAHIIEQADAEQAYTQANMDSLHPTWIRVPPHLRTPEMNKNPGEQWVMPLVKALYGHPQAGVFWERRLHAAVLEGGFTSLGTCGE